METEKTEDYLKIIDTIVEHKGYARTKDISEMLGVVPSTVTEMTQKLGKSGHINYEKYGGITLTAKGRKIAKRAKKKFNTIQNFLLILGVQEKIADSDAHRMEHFLNKETLELLTNFIEFVHLQDDSPRWLERFRYYSETGEYIECSVQKKDETQTSGGKSGS